MKYVIYLIGMLFLTACQPQPIQWKMGMQTYTFHKFTLTEALEKTRELNKNYIEAYFGQTIGEGFADSLYLDYTLDDSTLEQLKQVFKKNEISLYSLGVAMYQTEEEWKTFFEFANRMEVKVVSCEPPLDQLDIVEQLAKKYDLQVAIHNHPDVSIYADPAVLMKALQGRDMRMGACADPGHWKREGKNPVEVLQQLKGRIKTVHIKDLNAQMEDTVWGTGVLGVEQIVKELRKQQFDGLMAIEFENFSDNQMSQIKESIEYYNRIIKD